MFKPASLDKPPIGQGFWYYFRALIFKFFGTLEVIVLLLLWYIIFTRETIFAGYTREQIFVYLLVGGIIGLVSSYFLHRAIVRDVNFKESKLLAENPLRYFRQVISKNFGAELMPFFIALSLHSMLLYFLIDNIKLHFEPLIILSLVLMMAGAFIIELFLAYLLKLYAFWPIESEESYKVVIRFKKFLAGAYFPLNILPIIFVDISLFFPFAYSFFVPVQVYLRELELIAAWRGIIIEMAWIIILYILIRVSWRSKYKKAYVKK